MTPQHVGPMWRCLLLPPLIAGLAGCERIDTLDVAVRDAHRITITVPTGRCLDSLEIGSMKMKRTPVWRIERDQATHGPCITKVMFPDTPEGFVNTVPAQGLADGSYQIAGMAGKYAVAGHFDLPQL